MDSQKQYDFALRLWNADSKYREQVENIRALTRQRMPLDYELRGRKYVVAPTPRAMALVQMFAAFPEITPRISIPPLVQENKEDERATSIERFLKGIRRATQYGGVHPDDAVWIHGGEAGRGILYCQFDLDLAKEGLFPFRRKAIEPTTFSFKMSDRGLVCATQVEERDTLELYDELFGVWERVKENKPEWGIPEVLARAYEDYDSHPIRVMRFWDREKEFMWVGDECVWKMDGAEGRPHLMGRVPFDVGFVMQLPSDKPEELGSGIIKYVLGNLKNQSKMLDKAYLGFEFFFMPHVVLKETGNKIRFEQVTPGADYDNVVDVNIVNPTPNAPLMEQLLAHNDAEVNRASLGETVMSQDIPDVSGFLFSQANAGPQRRNNRLLDSITDAYKGHYNLILNRVEYFANEERARELCGNNKDLIANYMRAFTTHQPLKAQRNARVKNFVTLKSEDVKGYQIVDVDFKPEPPQDENAKFQRAQLAKSFMPQEYIDREVLKVESPEQVQQWRDDELLMGDADWATRMLAVKKRKRLETDKELTKEFQMQDLEALPLELQEVARQLLAQGVPFEEVMAWGDEQMAGMEQMQQPQMQDPNAMQVQTEPMMAQAQPPMQDPLQAQIEQFLAQLPPELQQVAIQMLQQGMPLEQVIEQIGMLLQQAQTPQSVPSQFVSSAQMGQQPFDPTQEVGMQGF